MAGEVSKADAAEKLAKAQQAAQDAEDAQAAQAARDKCVEAREWQERMHRIFPDDED